MKAILRKIDIVNFKGFAKATKLFDEVREIISAENGAGKSTFYDAFRWALCSGSDDIVPTINNKEITGLETSVEVTLTVDEFNYVLKRVQTEKWKVDKYTGERKKEGNECVYIFDGSVVTKKNYKDKIDSLLIASSNNLEMLICKEYFNSDGFDWRNRRKVLFDLCNVDDVVATLSGKPEYSLIAEDIQKGNSTAELKKRYTKERNGYKQQQDRNTIIIEEKAKEIAKYSDYDFEALRQEKDKLLDKIAKIQAQSRKENKNEVLESKTSELSQMVSELSKLQLAELTERNKKQAVAIDKWDKISLTKANGDKKNREITTYENEIIEAGATLEELETKQWNGETVCFHCGQALPADKIESAKADFEKHIADSKAKEQERLERNKKMLEICQKEIETLRNDYKAQVAEYNELKATLDQKTEDAAIKQLQDKIVVVKEELNNLKLKDVKTEVNNQISELQDKVEVINQKIGYKKIVADMKSRVNELKNEQNDLADLIVVCHKKEQQLTAFMLEQVNLVNDVVNSKFSNGVSFALFKELYRAGEGGLDEDCTCMFKGKKYSSMSTGERYFADLEVVKTLQREYGVNLPIFCDNSESVTRELQADQQIIELFVFSVENIMKVLNDISDSKLKETIRKELAKRSSKIEGVIPIENIL